jgi:hypothetical protein
LGVWCSDGLVARSESGEGARIERWGFIIVLVRGGIAEATIAFLLLLWRQMLLMLLLMCFFGLADDGVGAPVGVLVNGLWRPFFVLHGVGTLPLLNRGFPSGL